jgi:hypothetical protein
VHWHLRGDIGGLRRENIFGCNWFKAVWLASRTVPQWNMVGLTEEPQGFQASWKKITT